MLRRLVRYSASRGLRVSYLDNQATTRLDPRVLDAMLPYMSDCFGNPHSRSHAYGWESEKAVEEARQHVARLIGASDPKEIIFTSGATESNNMAIKGVVNYIRQSKKLPEPVHVITLQTEHKCVLASCRYLEEAGLASVSYLPVKQDGLVDLDVLRKAIIPGTTALVSIMTVNNEIGVVQPVNEIAEICKTAGVLFHTDAAQAVGKINVSVENTSLMSISGHKFYGPKGVGALYIRRRNPRVRIRPLMDGGGQERGHRSGTVPTPLVVGLGRASELALEELEADQRHVGGLYDYLLSEFRARIPDIIVNGSESARYKGNLNVSFSCVEGESLLMAMAQKCSLSSGSACTSASLEPSYVLRSIGVGEELAHTSIRFGIGRFTTRTEVKRAIEDLASNVARLRDMSPLWEMKLEEQSNPSGSSAGIKWS